MDRLKKLQKNNKAPAKSGSADGVAKATNSRPLRVNTESAIRTLFSQIWETRGYDQRLRRVLNDAMAALQVCGLVVHIAGRNVTFRHVIPRYAKSKVFGTFCENVALQSSRFDNSFATEVSTVETSDDFGGVIATFPLAGPVDIGPVGATKQSDINPGVHYCGLLFKIPWSHGGSGSVRAIEATAALHARSTAPLLFDVFRHRERRFSPFAPPVSEKYWLDSMSSNNENNENVLMPPWDCKQMLRTTTVSFDLRKSTFCMEQADEPSAFGQWLDELVQILISVCHKYGGIFDKFTGDGALIHFLRRECMAVYGSGSVEAAIECSVDMQRAIYVHLDRLRQFIRINSRLLGAGIAIDSAKAFWALDHRDNPITVGTGVVHACRLCDKTQSGKIRMTNIVRRRLPETLLVRMPQLYEVPLITKEVSEEMATTVWECDTPTPPIELNLGCSLSEVTKLCHGVYGRKVVAW